MKQFLKLIAAMLALLPVASTTGAQTAMREAGYLYLSPVPGAPYVSPQTRFVLVRFARVAPAAVTNLASTFISVTGSNSGAHSGATRVASDGRTVIFEMTGTFWSDERVTVTLNPQVDPPEPDAPRPFEFQFVINAAIPESAAPLPSRSASPAAPQPSLASAPKFPAPAFAPAATGNRLVATGGTRVMPNGVSVPSSFPQFAISINTNPSPGYLFIEKPYPIILDNHGWPVWYRVGPKSWDFKVQRNGTITWTVQHGAGSPAYDANFNYLTTYRTANGYSTDGHEIEVLANGNYLMLGLRTNGVDLSQYITGHSTNAMITEGVVQEFTAEGDLIFQWRAWDHYDIRDLVGGSPEGTRFDFPHMNALDVDEDGHLLVSSRHLHEVTKINRDTGEIIWRLGGTNSSFTFVDDPLGGLSMQHDITAQGGGRYLVFDNGNYHDPVVSRAVEYQLDLTNRTATLIWQFRDTPDKYSNYMGSAQRLPNGNTLINFVRPNYPRAIEVDSNGVKRFEMNILRQPDFYRLYRFPWNGVVAVPYLIAEPDVDNVTLLFNKFGDHSVAYYRIYGGPQAHPTAVVATTTATRVRLRNVVNGARNYFRVTAVSTNGVESDFSNEASLFVNLDTQKNLVRNGDFGQGTNGWRWILEGTADADWEIISEASRILVRDPGIYPADIQLSQGGIQLIQGREYVLEFDAWAPLQPRFIEVKLMPDGPPATDYLQLASPPFVTPSRNHYVYSFTMEQPTTSEARLVFNLGGGLLVFLDDVSLTLTASDAAPSGPTIALVSDGPRPEAAGNNPAEGALLDWLQRMGFTVDTTCMNGACQETNRPFNNAAIVAALQSADLILVSPGTDPAGYDDEAEEWNNLPVPLLLGNGALTGSAKWGWAACDVSPAQPATSTALHIEPAQVNHPFLKWLTAPVALFEGPAAPPSVVLPDCDPVAGSLVLGRLGEGVSGPLLFEIPAGTPLANRTPVAERRIFLGHGYQEAGTSWAEGLTGDYKTILLNILLNVLGLAPADLDRNGSVDYRDLAILTRDWRAQQSDLPADPNRDGQVDFRDFEILGDYWPGESP